MSRVHHFIIFTLTSRSVRRKEDAELLVYLVEEEKDIYICMLVLVCHLATLPCHLGPAQLEPFSYLGREGERLY
jgi:hypothetical protein